MPVDTQDPLMIRPLWNDRIKSQHPTAVQETSKFLLLKMKKMLSKIQLFLAEDMLVALGGGGYVGGLGVLRSKGLDAVTRTFENLPGAQIQAGR